jgi:Predicted phosphoesterase (MutT family)
LVNKLTQEIVKMGKVALAVARKDVVSVIETWRGEDEDNTLKINYEDEVRDSKTIYRRGRLTSQIYSLDSVLLDRPECETNREYLQLLPYIVFMGIGDDMQPTGKILTYQRGKAGDENRLHNKYSVGIGGHIEEAPTESKDLLTVIIDSTFREIQEELNISLDDLAKSVNTTADIYYKVVKDWFEYSAFLLYHSDDVGSVHLGLGFIIGVKESLLEKAIGENNVINNLKLMDYESEFKPMVESSTTAVEGWTALCCDLMESGYLIAASPTYVIGVE